MLQLFYSEYRLINRLHHDQILIISNSTVQMFHHALTTFQMWDLSGRTLCHSVTLPHPATHTSLHRDSNLLAVALDNCTVCVVDVDTRKVVRQFRHSDTVLDMVCTVYF